MEILIIFAYLKIHFFENSIKMPKGYVFLDNYTGKDRERQTKDYGVVHMLRNHFLEIIDEILRPEVATVRCGQRPQHL